MFLAALDHLQMSLTASESFLQASLHYLCMSLPMEAFRLHQIQPK